MSLVFAGISPHSPILVPTVAGAAPTKLPKTVAALQELEYRLYASRPDILIILTPHGPVAADHFTICLSPSFTGTLKEFGDLTTSLTVRANHELAARVVEGAKHDGVPVHLASDTALDYGVTVPLLFLTTHLQDFTLMPVRTSLLSRAQHRMFGVTMRQEILLSTARVAVLASGDLAHTHDHASKRTSPNATAFDRSIRRLLTHDPAAIASMDEKLVADDVGQCLFRPLLILLGILESHRYRTHVLSYEAPFGAGYLTATIDLG